MFRRKIEEQLLDWKKSTDKMPMVIKGCRQCGKTSSVLDFAYKNYKNVVYLDFFQNPEYKAIFDGSLEIDNILMNISTLVPSANMVEGETCLVFDEIQDCPRPRTSLKFFKTDGRFDVVCTGSLLGVSGYKSRYDIDNRAPVPVGYETIIDMYPMDFEEWLWANDIQEPVISKLEGCMESFTPVPEVIRFWKDGT